MTLQDYEAKKKKIQDNKFLPAENKTQLLAKLDKDFAASGAEKKENTPAKKPQSIKKRDTHQSLKHKVRGHDKTVKDIDCDELLREHNKRMEQRKKSERKHKTTSVIERVAHNVVTGVKQAINNIPAQSIKDNPKKEISKLEKLKKLTTDYLRGFKDIMGEDYSASDVNEELKALDVIIDKLEKKYTEKE